jgi:hypothetical protein
MRDEVASSIIGFDHHQMVDRVLRGWFLVVTPKRVKRIAWGA